MTTRASRVTEGRPDILYCHDEDVSRPVTERDGTLRARTLTRLIVCPVGVADLAGMEVSRAVALRGPDGLGSHIRCRPLGLCGRSGPSSLPCAPSGSRWAGT